MPPLLVTIDAGGGGLTVRPSGELDAATAPALDDAVTAACVTELPVTLDLAAVSFCDAAGLRVLLRARASGVTLTNPSAAVTRLLRAVSPHPAHYGVVTAGG